MSASYFPPIISSIYLEELAGQATEAKDSALVALNAAEAARDTALEYRNDAQTYYTQVQQIQEGDYVTNLSLEERLGAFNFADLQGIPATFTPSSHGHSWSEIANKPTMYPPTAHGHAWSEITGKPSEFEPAPHIHTWQQIAQKPGTFPPETHFHSWNEIENKPNVFNPAAHTHSWGDISGKPTKFEPADHVHTWDMLENKPLTFPPQSHHHHWSQVTSKPEQATRWPSFDEVTLKPAQATRWPTFNEVTDKPEQATRWPSYSEVKNKPVLGTAAAKNVGSNPGELMEVGHAGLGKVSNTDYLQDILDPDIPTGFYTYTSSTANAPSVFGTVIIQKRSGTGQRTYIATSGQESGDTYLRHTNDAAGEDSGWRKVYSSGSVNLNEFGGQQASDDVAIGVGVSSSLVNFHIPINAYSTPSGVSVEGSFEVENVSRQTIGAGISSFTLNGRTSNRMIVLSVPGLSGVVVGDIYHLSTESVASKLTINY